MKVVTLETASPTGMVKLAELPIRELSRWAALLLSLRLVEEAPLEHPRPVLGGELDVARREQEDLVGDPLHPTVEGVRETARKVDQALGELAVRRLEVEDHRDSVLEPVGDLLRVVEAARQDQVHPGGAGALDGLEVAHAARLAPRPQDARPLRVGLGVGPVVVVVVPRPARRKAAHVLLLVPLRELVLGEIAVLVPVLFLGDAEVDERTGPDIGESHAGRGWYRGGPTVPTRLARPGAPGPRLVHGRSSLAEERRADPHVGRSLLGGDPVVLARAH